MMDIRIKQLSLTNFKCFRFKEFFFDREITTIRGGNGQGKTTIADAITFCLFGKTSDGKSDLELFKTSKDKKVIPHLDHYVEMVIVTEHDGTKLEVTLKRAIKEVWIKKHGSDETVFKNNTVEYYVNGESYKKDEYEKYIASLIDERIFKAITNPLYFTSLNWKDQRDLLLNFASDVGISAIYGENEELKKYVHEVLAVKHESNEEHLKGIKSKIKCIKEKLERIPIRLEEQNKALPESLDWDAIEVKKVDAEQRLNEIDEKISALQKGNGADIKRDEIRKQINETNNKVMEIEQTVMAAYSEDYKQWRSKIDAESVKFNEALTNQRLLEQTIEADKRLIERCKETIEECGKTREQLLSQWPTEKFVFDKENSFCPTCGQYLPEEQVAEKREKMRQAFNLDLERRKQEINEKGRKNNELKAKSEEELKQYEQKLTDDTKSLEDIKENINTIFSNKAKLEKDTVKSKDDRLKENEEYNRLVSEVTKLKGQLSLVTDDESDEATLLDLKAQRAIIYTNFCSHTQQLALKGEYNRISQLIEDINKEEKDLVKQLSELEKEEDIATLYQTRQNQVLEERINKHFKLVQWRLFETVNNGGDSFDKPACECYVNGIAYHSGLNQADRINAGLDICETFSRFYGSYAPIIIDNAESNLNIYQTTGQQVRLQVFPSNLMQV